MPPQIVKKLNFNKIFDFYEIVAFKNKSVADFNPQAEFISAEDRDYFVYLHSKDAKYTAGPVLRFFARNASISCKAVDFFDSQKEALLYKDFLLFKKTT